MSTITSSYTVTGMTCGHCVSAVESEVGDVPGVSGVEVDLSTGSLTITSATPIEEELVRAAVDEAGYTLTEATRSGD